MPVSDVSPLMPRIRQAAALALVASLAACSRSVEPPLAVGLDAEDPEVAEYLADMVASASGLPASAALRGRLGLAYDANGFNDAASMTYGQARGLDPSDFGWPYLQAFTLVTGGETEAGLLALDAAIALDDGYAPALMQRGTWLLDVDRIDEAAESFRRAAALAPSGPLYVAATAGMARVMLRKQDGDAAVRLLEPLLADTNHPQLQLLLARAHRLAGRGSETAVADAPPLTWPDPRRAGVDEHVRGFHGRLGVAEARLQQGDTWQAAAMFEELNRRRPDDRTVINNLAIAYQGSGRAEQAVAVLREGLAKHPGHALFHFNLGSLHEEAGREEQAAEQFGAAVAADPSLTSAYERRAMLLMRRGDWGGARADLEALVERVHAVPSFHHAAMIAGAGGAWPVAIELLTRAVELEPAFADGHLFLGRALAEGGNFADARVALAQAEVLGSEADALQAAHQRIAELAAVP